MSMNVRLMKLIATKTPIVPIQSEATAVTVEKVIMDTAERVTGASVMINRARQIKLASPLQL